MRIALKVNLDKFREQVEKRFEKGYKRVVVVVVNQKQKLRYQRVLEILKSIEVVKFTELAKIVKGE